MTRLQLSDDFKVESEFNTKLMDQMRDAELKSYGFLVNSFYELEPAYAEHYKNVMGRRAWHIGPVSLRNRETMDKVQRGKKAPIDEHYVLNWLDTKEPKSVIYICFGSMSRVGRAQLLEIAMGLEDSGFSFVWVVRTLKNKEEERFLPEGFEERMEGKGLIIREWAPQVLILDHPAVGGFMTHCGWNSILEGVTAGVPMITWPLFAEQFHNENLVTRVLKIGIRVGAEQWNSWIEAKDAAVKKEKIGSVVIQLMGDREEAEEMRTRAKEFSEMARRAVEEGGSSYADLTALIEELKTYRKPST
ncbi:UDP-glucuronosyl/UDP-glucosyltransferase [Macleaya cordata]|uniref:UDP-glucuronosyl/UDP-glucosyltransferase n=1 Tax=Macleaya cordata TaxID=56857 RepID=A0A200R8F7_MACCD|nr:UDP-glucuronosyl/UDP-glucosyltransferase [Macleaya cordata]